MDGKDLQKKQENVKKKEVNVEEIFERLKIFYNVSTFTELAKKLRIKENVLFVWKRRKTFNLNELYSKIENINWHWLITGEGDMRPGSRRESELVAQVEYLLRYVKKLEEENDLLKAMLKNLLAKTEEKQDNDDTEAEPRSAETTKSVPFVRLPDEAKIFEREKEKK